MNYVEKSGKTVEDAVQAGLRELGKTSSDVTIDVLEYGSPGLFGMFGKLARVRLTVREAEPEFEMPIFSLDQQPEPSKKAKKPEPKPEAKPEIRPEVKPEPKPAPKPETKPEPKPEPKPMQRAEMRSAPKPETRPAPRQERAPAPVQAEGEGQTPSTREPRPPRPPRPPRKPRPEGDRPERPQRNRPPLEPPSMEDLPPLDLTALSADAKLAYEFIRQLTSLMRVDVEIRVKETEGHLQVQIMGDTLGVLIGRRGETLDAMQYLTSLQVNKGRDEYLRVTLDTEHYRAKREEALTRLAERMANRARKTGHRVALEPMNPSERRVLHSALQDDPYVTTHSEGDEPYRRVIITLK